MRRLHLAIGASMTPVLACLALGCGTLPHSQLAECHNRSQALQAEADQLKNEALGLRDRNRELAQRALEDAHRIHALEQSNTKLERSILAYQEERNRLVEAFEQLQSQIRTAAVTGPPRAGMERLETFARAHPGSRFDATRRVLGLPSDLLFQPDSDALKPGSEVLLAALGRILYEPESGLEPGRVLISCHSPGRIIRASSDTGGGTPESELGRRRARRVRDGLATALKAAPLVIDVAEPGEPSETTRRVSAEETELIEIALGDRVEATASERGTSRADHTHSPDGGLRQDP
jgi:outer membrane protein OmpA-like peptidoglycan-associated protein